MPPTVFEIIMSLTKSKYEKKKKINNKGDFLKCSYNSKKYVSFCLAKLYEHAKFDFDTSLLSFKIYNGQILKIMKTRIMNS
jgi:hypothetical protein